MSDLFNVYVNSEFKLAEAPPLFKEKQLEAV